jgi:hypothetical protein
VKADETLDDDDVQQWGDTTIYRANMALAIGKQQPSSRSNNMNMSLLFDSGTNVNVAGYQHARIMGLPIFPTYPHIPIMFGNGNVIQSKHHIVVGGCVGSIQLVEGAQQMLLSSDYMEAMGCTIIIHQSKLLVYTVDNILAHTIDKCHKSRLYYLPIAAILNMTQQQGVVTQANSGQQGVVTQANSGSQLFPTSRSGTRVTYRAAAEVVRLVMQFHRVTGHASARVMAKAIRDGSWKNAPVTAGDVETVFNKVTCVACAIAKTNNLTRQVGAGIVNPAPGFSISLDFKQVNPISIGGHVGMFTFVDLATGMFHPRPVKSKADLTPHVDSIIAYYAVYGWPVRFIRCDAGSVETAHAFQQHLMDKDILLQPALPEAQNQNPVERATQTCVKGVAATLADQDVLGAKWWNFAVEYWAIIRGCIPNSRTAEETPLFVITGTVPDMTRFRFPFGTVVTSAVVGAAPPGGRPTFEPANEVGIVVCPTPTANKGFLVYIPSRGHGRVYERRDLVEIKLPSLEDAGNPSAEPAQSTFGKIAVLASGGDTSWLTQQESEHESSFQSSNLPSSSSPSEIDAMGTLVSAGTHVPQDPLHRKRGRPAANVAENNLVIKQRRILRSTGILSPHDQESGVHMAASAQVIRNPAVNPTLTQALASTDKDKWVEAMRVEITMQQQQGTHRVITRSDVPRGSQILPSKWVLTRKRDGRFKARLVALGNRETVLENLYSPTVDAFTLRFVIALAINLGWSLRGYDVYGAFCVPTQQRKVFMRLPDGTIWELLKTLYGLSDSPVRFYEHLRNTLQAGGYTQCVNDQCLFVKRNTKGEVLVAVIHVDDFAVASNSQAMHEELVQVLEQTYVISKFPLLQDFLGVHMEHHPDGAIALHTTDYLTKLVCKYAPDPILPVTSPMDPTFSDAVQDLSPPADTGKVMSIMGQLMFAARTRHDVAFAVNRLAARVHRATELDFSAMIRIVRYLKGSLHICLTYYPDQHFRHHDVKRWIGQFSVFCDAATSVYDDSKGQSAVCVRLGNDARSGMCCVRTVKQKVVASCACHCEAICAMGAVKLIVWLRNLAAELGVPQQGPTPLYCDNKAMIKLFTEFSGNHKRVKHFLHAIHFVMDHVKQGTVELIYLAGLEHPADGLSKPKSGRSQQDDVSRLQGVQHRLSTGRGV